MWEFMNNNAQALSVVASFGTMAVWIFYAQLLWKGFSRQRQARLLINQGWGEEIDSVALVSNMSHEPVYIQCVILSMRTHDGHKFRSSVTDFDDAEPFDAQNNPSEVTRQGPLNTGGYMNLGTFRTLIRQSVKQHDLVHDETNPMAAIGLRDFKLTVICHYGPSGQAIGVQRRFLISGEDNQKLRPASIYSRRLNRYAARQKLTRWLKEQI